MDGDTLAMVGVAVAFAFSMGAHYTGACMGMPVAARAVRGDAALLWMAPLVLVGAVLAGPQVERTIGENLVRGGSLPVVAAIAVLLSAFLLTTAYNALRLPTSTIQVLVFSLVGVVEVLGAPFRIAWGTLEVLLALWAAAPLLAFVLGYALSRRLRPAGEQATPSAPAPSAPSAEGGRRSPWLRVLFMIGLAASFVMGANDVSNASAALVSTGRFSLLTAAVVGGAGLSLGVLTWGRPLLRRTSSEIATLSPSMASAAQLGQSLVVLASVLLGYFTSMNQALVGAIAGASLARGRRTLRWTVVRTILVGWAVGPASGLALGAALAWVAGLLGTLGP